MGRCDHGRGRWGDGLVFTPAQSDRVAEHPDSWCRAWNAWGSQEFSVSLSRGAYLTLPLPSLSL